MTGSQMNTGNYISCFLRLMFYLLSSIEVEHQTLPLGDDAPHLLPRFVFLTVLQEATYNAAACELSCLNLHERGKSMANTFKMNKNQTS